MSAPQQDGSHNERFSSTDRTPRAQSYVKLRKSRRIGLWSIYRWFKRRKVRPFGPDS